MTMTENLELVSANKSFGGWHKRYRHRSRALDCEMVFAIYLPPQAETERVPLLWWLSGLTCTDENFMQKADRKSTRLNSSHVRISYAVFCLKKKKKKKRTHKQ